MSLSEPVVEAKMSATTSPVSVRSCVEHGQFPHRHIFAAGDEALIFGEPVVPLRAGAVGGLDGPMAVGNGIGRVADIAGCRLRDWPRSSSALPSPPRCRSRGCATRRAETACSASRCWSRFESSPCSSRSKSGLILQIMREERRLDSRAKLRADGLAVIADCPGARDDEDQ